MLKLAKAGLPVSMMEMHTAYSWCIGVEKSDSEAQRWLYEAAQHGEARYQYDLGHSYIEKGKLKDAEIWYLKAAEQGLLDAKYHLALLYLNDSDLFIGRSSRHLDFEGFPRNTTKGKYWLQNCAENNYFEAIEKLGDLFEQEGANGNTSAMKTALHWYKLGAELGYPPCAFKLASFYKDGRIGIQVDGREALRWF